VRAGLDAWFDQVWEGAQGCPRSAASDALVASTYTQWVWGGVPAGPPPHCTAVLGHKAKCTLMRLRATGCPLRIATGRNEGAGGRSAQHTRGRGRGVRRGGAAQRGSSRGGLSQAPQRGRGIPREQRVCLVCHGGMVEDLKHFLLECPAYAAIKQAHPALFAPPPQSTPAILHHDDQHCVASAVMAMLAHRQYSQLGRAKANPMYCTRSTVAATMSPCGFRVTVLTV